MNFLLSALSTHTVEVYVKQAKYLYIYICIYIYAFVINLDIFGTKVLNTLKRQGGAMMTLSELSKILKSLIILINLSLLFLVLLMIWALCSKKISRFTSNSDSSISVYYYCWALQILLNSTSYSKDINLTFLIQWKIPVLLKKHYLKHLTDQVEKLIKRMR